MDNFEFDLQLFADGDPVTVDLSTLKDTLKTATKYLVDGVWQDTAPESPATAVATLGNGKLTVTAVAAAEVVLTGVETSDLTGVQVVRTEAGKITVGDDGSIASAKSLQFTANGIVADASEGVQVSAAGVVSGLADEKSFSVYTSMSDTQPTTYTAGETTLAVTGDKVGTYTVTTIGNVKVALANGKVTEGENEVTTITVPENFTPAEQTTAGDKYYAVTVVDGEYVVAESAAGEAATEAVGYFKVTTAANYGKPTATVTFVKEYNGSTPVALLGNVTIDVQNLDSVTVGQTPTGIKTLTIDVATTGKVSVTNVTNTADVVIGDKTYTKDSTGVVAYEKTYSLGNAKTISLNGLTDTDTTDGNATTYYFEIKATDSEDHGKQVYSISTDKVAEAAKDSSKSYFSVAVKTTGGATTYTVDFATGSSGPASLTGIDWSGIQINAAGISSTTGNTAKIIVSGDETAEATDTYVVNNAAIGVVVEPVDGKLSASNINRAAGTVATTLDITDGNKITLTKTAGTVYYQIVKTDPANDGNQTLTVTKAAGTPSAENLAAGNYIKVTTATEANKTTCTVSYTGNVSLSGLTDGTNAVQIPLVPATEGDGALTNAVEVVITDTDNTVDYSISNLPAGTKVTGAGTGDSVTYAEGMFNGVNIELAKLTANLEDGQSVSYAVKQGDKDSATGYKTVSLGDKLTGDPTADDNYFTITKTDKTYTVTYTKATTEGKVIDLSTATGGATNIDTTGITDKDTVIQLVSTGVNGYTATNVVTGGFNVDKGIQVGTMTGETPTFTGDVLDDANITYLLSNSFVQEVGNEIDLGNTDKVYTVVATGPSKGVTTYTLAEVADVATAGTKSYFKVTKEGTTVTLTYVEGTDGVSRETFANAISDKINVKAPTSTEITAIVLTDDKENALNYNVTGINAGVDVVNATANKDTLVYTPKYVFGETDSTLTVGATEGKTYYEVVPGDPDKGIYTCTLKAIDVTGKTADQITELLNGKNYFTVNVTDNGAAATVQYTSATEGAIALGADATLNIDTSKAQDNVTVTVGMGASDGAINFTAAGLGKKQNVAVVADSPTKVSYTYEESNTVAYTGGSSIALEELSSGTKYYVITHDNGASAGDLSAGQDTTSTKHGITTYTIAAATTTKPTTGAYFAVTYGSAYITTISYVNVAGTSDYNLADIADQISIDAGNLPVTVTTIDITDSEDSKVNYALKNVRSNVTVEGAGEGDTVAKVGGEVTLADSITLTKVAKAYYVVGADGTLTASEAPTSADNYITVTKTGENYDISYTQSTTGTAYTLANDGVLTVDAKDAAKGAISKTGVTAKVNVTNAQPGTTASTVDSISFKTGFAWAAGTYYLPIEGAASDVTLDSTATAGSTTKNGKYVIINVTEDDGVYKVTSVGNVAVANDSAVEVGDENYSGSVTLAAPATAVKLDGTKLAANYITGVAKDSVLTEIGLGVEVTTAELAKGDSVSISANNEGNAIKYTAGADSAITVVGGKIKEGVLALSEANATLTGSAESTKSVTLVESSNGVVVTYAEGKVASITGLDAANEKVSYNGDTYIFNAGGLVRKFNATNGTSEWAVVSADGDILHADYYEGTAEAPTALQVGGFQWAASGSPYYVKGNTVAATDDEKTALTGGTDNYLKVELSANNTISKITVLKNNTQGLPTTVADAKDTVVNIEAGTTALTYEKAETATFTVNITNAASGSSFKLGDKDTVTTAGLADNATAVINEVTYTATGMGDGNTQQLSFKGNALSSGTIKLTVGASDYALSDGSTVKVTTDTEAVITMKDGAIQSITGLGVDNEEIVITNGNTETSFKVTDATNKKVTKTVKNTLTGESSTSVITLAETDADVWKATAGEATYTYQNTLNFASNTHTEALYGYFKATYNEDHYEAEVNNTGATDKTMKNGEPYFKAELTPVYSEADSPQFLYNTLTLTAGTIVNGVFTPDTTGALNAAVITVNAGTGAQKLQFTNDDNFNVHLQNVPAGSELTLKKNDAVTTASLTDGQSITINGQDYTAKADGVLNFGAKTASEICLVGAGTVLVTGTLAAIAGSDSDNAGQDGTTVTYTAKSGVKAGEAGNDGVVVTYNADGVVTSITGLDAGETVVTQTGTVTKTYTANSKEADIVTVTVTGETDSNKNGTFVKDIGTALTSDIVGNTDGAKAVSNEYTFNWAGAKAATDTESAKDATGYFLVDADGKITVNTTPVKIDNTTYDKDQKVVKATLKADGTLTLTKSNIDITGAVSDTTDASEATAVTLAITGAQTVKYNTPANITLNVTGAGAGSVFNGSIDANDKIATAALAKGAEITVGTKVYTAGANNDTLVINGTGTVESGTFTLKAGTGVNTLTAYTKADNIAELDSDDVVTTTTNVTYTGADANGANVVVKDGIVTSVTGMGDGETVTVVETTTTKGNGKPSIVTTEYSSELQNSVYVVTKTVTDAQGKVTHYTQNFANDAQDVTKTTGWTLTGQTTTTKFDFAATEAGSVGYFKATKVDGSNTYTLGTTPIAAQAEAATISGNSDQECYVRVTASRNVANVITIESITLVQLEATGAWTESKKALTGTVKLTVPDGADLVLPTDARTYTLAMTSNGAGSIANVQAGDTITGTQAEGAVLKVNGTGFVAANANNAFELSANETTGKIVVTKGTFVVKDAALTAAKSDDAVSYTKGTAEGSQDGVKVAFSGGEINSITDLDDGETVTVTAADGTETVYGREGTTFTKTVGGETYTKVVSETPESKNILTDIAYGLNSQFDWGATKAGSIGYFEVTGNPVTVAAQTTGQAVEPAADKIYARVQVSGSAEAGYTISSVKLLKGETLTDVTTATTTSTVAITLEAPGSLALADAPADRKYTLTITGAKDGQSFTGLSADDKVSTAELTSATITVNGETYTTAVPSVITINGDGTAKSGQFALTSSNDITLHDSSGKTISITTTKGNGATVVVADNELKGINKMNAGDVVVVTTKLQNGVTMTETYEAKSGEGSAIEITKTTVADGATTKEVCTVDNDGENILMGEYTAAATGNSITGQLNWTATSGSTGYFLVEPTVDTESGQVTGFAKDVAVANESKPTTITAKDAGNVYLKVSTAYDADAKTVYVSAIQPLMVAANGTLTDEGIGAAATFKGTVNITAPTGASLVIDTRSSDGLKVPANVKVNISGAAAGSAITMKNGDSLTTAVLAADQVITVNGQDFTTAANGALKFTANAAGNAVMADGTVKVLFEGTATTASFKAAGMTTADNDDVTVTVAGTPAVVTVTNGIVTAISGQTENGNTVTVAANGAESTVYTYDSAAKVYNAVVSGTTTGQVTLAALASGATATIGGKTYTSSADNNSLVFYGGNLQSGKVTLTATGSITAVGADAAVATDDIQVAYTKAGTAGTAGAANITVVQGKVTGISGLAAGDSIVVTEVNGGTQTDGTVADKVTTYTVTSAGTVEKTVKVGADDASAAQTAYITSGGDIFTANYIGGTSDASLVGQFNWNTAINGRTVGYFAITEDKNGVKKASIADQATEVFATAKGTEAKPVTKKYLVASLDSETRTLSIGAMSVTNNGSESTTEVLDVTDATKFTAADKITITAPATNAITYDKGNALFGVTINKLAAGSSISNLDAGDKVVTTTLAEGDKVTFNGKKYVAGAKGVLTFVGEGDAVAETPTDGVALLSGTIKVEAGATAVLSGATEAKDAGLSDDIHITATNDDVIVKVANGVITSITGLTIPNATVLTKTGSSAVLYTVLADNNMIMKQEWTDTDGEGDADESGVTTSYLNLTKAGGEIYKASYKAAADPIASDFSFSDVEKTTKTYGYVALDNLYDDKTIKPLAVDSSAENDLIASANAVPGSYYLKVTATTTNKGVTTINAVDLMKAGATGALTAVKSSDDAVYSGTLNIDGTKTAGDTPTYAVLNYALPAASKRNWHLNVTNAALGSTFTNLGSADTVTTANTGDAGYALKGKTVTVYKGTETTQVTAKGDGVNMVVDSGVVTKVTGFGSNGETLTVVSKDPSDGLATYVYKSVVNKDGKVTITRTITDQNGNNNVSTVSMSKDEAETLILLPAGAATYTPTGGAAGTNVAWATPDANRTVVSDFDWTMSKAAVGYFAVSKGAANVKAGKTTISSKNAAAKYIAVEISADGVVKSVKQMAFDTTEEATATEATNMAESGTFTGKLNITAPTAVALNFDRTALGDSIDSENTTVAVSGAIAGSAISGLANGDTVTTAKLAVGKSVTIGGNMYTAAVAGSVGFAHKADTDVVTAGTVKLTGAGSNQTGTDLIYLYNGSEVVPVQVTAGSITVKAATNKSGVTTFTIGDLGENETFTVGEVTYLRSGNTLFKSVDGEITGVYAIGKATTVTSAVLDGTKSWSSLTKTFYDGEDGTEQKSSFGVVTTNLNSIDARYKADVKAGTYDGAYDYVLDTYVKQGTKESAKATLNAILVNNVNTVWQTRVGTADYTTSIYTANTAIGQAIKVAANWSVIGSNYDDTITGAAKGTNTITVGAGNDTVNLGGASETVVIDLADKGQNKVNNYASGKDEIEITGNFDVHLDNTKSGSGNVYLYADSDGEDGFTAGDNYVMLKGMGNGKAVTINDTKFYFGNGYNTKAGTAFAYEAGAYYIGNTSGKNSLKVTTDKTKYSKNTLGDDVVIDLGAAGESGQNYYNNISTVDASASGNRLVLQAAAAGSTLKGGTYQSTLKSGAGNDTLQGGSGQDVFWFDDLGGNDTVKSYTSGKDAVYLGGNTDLTTDYNVKASGNDVVITKDGDNTSSLKIAGAVNAAKAITVSKDGKVGGESVSYFVGKSGAKVSNAFTYVDGAYYIGNTETKDATSTAKYLDTLKVTGTVKSKIEAEDKLTIALTDSNYQSIEAVDASARKVAKNVDSTNAGVNVTASNAGTRFTGTAYADSFNCGNGSDYIVYKVNQGADTIDSFGVGDVIQLNGLTGVDKTAIAAEIDKINAGTSTSSTLSFAKGGSVKFTGFDNTTTKLTYDSKKGTITGTAIN